MQWCVCVCVCVRARAGVRVRKECALEWREVVLALENKNLLLTCFTSR